MAISKKITLTIDGYSCKLSSSLQFYRNDALHLIFSINEYGITVSGNGTKSRVLTPLTPLSGFLLIETPDNVDYIESVAVVNDEIHFHIDGKYTNFIGVSRMQIILNDENCCRITLPEFNFEIRENLTESQLNLADTMIVDNYGIVLMTDDGEGITTGSTLVIGEAPTSAKYIKDLEEKTNLDGTEKLIIQDDENTKYTTTESLYNFYMEYFNEQVQEDIKNVLGTNADELNQLKATLCSLISNATSDLVAIEKLKRDYEAKLENLTQGSEE